ncbi:CLUMA_CG014465, isoform A [Clunio marinus]|uniref:CLUMA_CG014465, isoform A n=1 Tax=Clunio marinus TaxID=568069 RepID=A0A1J1IMN7_9DIPT|nr:CLUMA_CG014465, isoform A [Clunio marinus]
MLKVITNQSDIVIMILTVTMTINITSAIQCDFKYVLDDEQSNENAEGSLNSLNEVVTVSKTKSQQTIFECEDPYDDYEAITDVSSRVKPMELDTRFGEDDEYESVRSDCPSNKKTIRPRALNNVLNQFMTIAVVQAIEIDECGTRNEHCSGPPAPIGQLRLCRQQFVTITMKAYKNNETLDETVDQPFYFPSHCVCELVQKRKKPLLV